MAYVDKEVIQKARAAVKELNKKWNMKVTVSGLNSSTLTATVHSGALDLIANACEQKEHSKECAYNLTAVEIKERIEYLRNTRHIQINHYHLETQFSGKAFEFMQELLDILNADHWDKSDLMTDYFNCSFYIDLNVGKWNKPYECMV